MKSLYVVMQGGSSPIAIIIPTPRAVFRTRKAATAYINTKRYPGEWYVRKVDNYAESDQ